MSYRSYLIALSILTLFVPLFVVGIDPTTSGRIIDAFKREEYAMLFENLPFDQSGSSDIYAREYTLNGLE